jgi:hypothetical protein
MFCDGCGTAVRPGQGFCSSCGKQIIGPIGSARQYPGRVQQHTTLLSILWLALSAMNAVGGIVLLIVADRLFPHLRATGAMGPEVPVGFLTSVVTALGIVVLGKSACGFIAAWGLMKHEPWARIVALVFAFLSLFNVPFGTALGIYTMWVLLPGESQREYEALAEAKAA